MESDNNDNDDSDVDDGVASLRIQGPDISLVLGFGKFLPLLLNCSLWPCLDVA